MKRCRSGIETSEIVINGTTMANPQVTLLEPPAGGCGGGTFTLLDCQSPGGAATINYSSLVIGDTYYLFVDGQNNEEGTFEACITSLSAPLNDDPCSPFTIPANNFCSAAGAYTSRLWERSERASDEFLIMLMKRIERVGAQRCYSGGEVLLSPRV